MRRRNRQKGFLIPLSLVIILGVGALATAVSKLTQRSDVSALQEGLSLQAFYAAESGAQFALNQIFFSANNRSATDANCVSLSGDTLSFSAAAMSHCSAVLNCSISFDQANTVSFYRIVSTGSCGLGQIQGQRSIAVAARM